MISVVFIYGVDPLLHIETFITGEDRWLMCTQMRSE